MWVVLYQIGSRCVLDMASSCISCAVHEVQRGKLLSTSICHRRVYDSCHLGLDFRVFLSYDVNSWLKTKVRICWQCFTVWFDIGVRSWSSCFYIELHCESNVDFGKTALKMFLICAVYRRISTDPHLHSCVFGLVKTRLGP